MYICFGDINQIHELDIGINDNVLVIVDLKPYFVLPQEFLKFVNSFHCYFDTSFNCF